LKEKLTPTSLGHCMILQLICSNTYNARKCIVIFRSIFLQGMLLGWLVTSLNWTRNLAHTHVTPGIFSWPVVCTWEYHFKHMKYNKMNRSSRIWEVFHSIASESTG
jgi:hypothetical protein